MKLLRLTGSCTLLAVATFTARPTPCSADVPTASTAVGLIDREIETKLGSVTPAGPCTDAEFLRRVTLDLTGVVPSVEEAKQFLAQPDRATLIERLIESTAFDAGWARVLLEETTARRAADYDGFEGSFLFRWYRKQLERRRPYDEIVRDMITGSGNAEKNPAVNFFLINNVTPSDMVGRIGSAFLGTTLSCAQCHNHPFDTAFSQKDFWGVAGFLSNTKMFVNDADTDCEVRGVEDAAVGEEGNPKAPSLPVEPHWFLSSTEETRGTRSELAVFVTSDPLFAKNIVNRIWFRLLGHGFVEPITGFGSNADPTHPELLDGLAERFKESHYDLRALVRWIVSSRAYQRSSKPGDSKSVPYAEATLRPLTCDQLYRSIRAATNYTTVQHYVWTVPPEDWEGKVRMNRLSYDDLTPPQIFGKYAGTLRREVALLNSSQIHAAVAAGAKNLAKPKETIKDSHFDAIFLGLLSRPPTDDERRHFPRNPSRADLEDVYWVVINSLEFQNNH